VQQATDKQYPDTSILPQQTRRYLTIRGTLKDQTGMGFAGVSIKTSEGSYAISTDTSGYFLLELPSEWKGDVVNITVSHVGFMTTDLSLSLLTEHSLDLCMEPTAMGMIELTPRMKWRMFRYRVTHLFK